jgi:hypothetical protein
MLSKGEVVAVLDDFVLFWFCEGGLGLNALGGREPIAGLLGGAWGEGYVC